MKYCLTFVGYIFFLLSFSTANAKAVVNVYIWGGEIPRHVIQQFETQTGITVNFSTYDSNETMYAKLLASKQTIYDVILPSSYFVERMRKQNMLLPLDSSKLPNLHNLEPLFTQQDYDRNNRYSVPLTWGVTGIYTNRQWVKIPQHSWNDLWNSQWHKQLMLLDDSREVFAMALLSLGYQPNDQDPAHIEKAYHKLLRLVPNIKLFGSDGIQAVMIDGDAIAGLAWNGDAYKAHRENQAIHFTYPDEGFVAWVDCLAIPRQAPHPVEAYRFINFLLDPHVSAEIAKSEGHAITNAGGKRLLPEKIRTNPMVYPSPTTLKRAYFQRDVGEATLALYNKYWEELKMAF